MIGSASPDNEFANTPDQIQCTGRCLRCKPFIDVVVPVQDEVGIVVVEQLPERQGILRSASSGTEERNMPVSQCAQVCMGCQVVLQPFVLSGS